MKFLAETRDAEGKISGLETKVSGFDTKLGGIGKTAAGFAIGGGLLKLPGLLLDGAKGAAADQLSMDKLKQAVTNAGGSFDKMAPAIDDAIKRGQDLAFTDGETTDALATLTSLTGDSDEAMRRLGPAMDLARGAGISLEQASKLLGKTSDENTTALARLGIKLGEGATAQDVLNAVDEKYKGQAGVYAESSAGQMEIASQQAGELAETFGGALIPVIGLVTSGMLMVVDAINTYVVPAFNNLVAVIEPIISFIGENLTPILLFLAPALIAIGGALLASVIPAIVTWTVATYGQVTALLAQAAAFALAYAPIIAIVAAVGLALVAFYEAWQHNLFGIQDIVKSVIDFIVPYLQAAWDTILLAVQTVMDAILTAWNTVWPVMQTVIETVFPIIQSVVSTYIGLVQTVIETVLGIIQTAWDTVWPAIQATVETVWPIIQTAVETATGAVQTAIQTLIDGVNLIWQPFWDGIKSVVDLIFNAADGILSIVDTATGGVKTAFETAKDGILGAWSAIWDPVKETIRGVKTVVEEIVGDIIGIVNGVISKINGAIGRINSAFEFTIHIPGVDMPGPIPDIPGMDFSFDAPDIPSIPTIGGGGDSYGGTGHESSMSTQGAAGPFGASKPPPKGFTNPALGLGGGSSAYASASGGMRGDMVPVTMYIDRREAEQLVNGSMTAMMKLRPV